MFAYFAVNITFNILLIIRIKKIFILNTLNVNKRIKTKRFSIFTFH